MLINNFNSFLNICYIVQLNMYYLLYLSMASSQFVFVYLNLYLKYYLKILTKTQKHLVLNFFITQHQYNFPKDETFWVDCKVRFYTLDPASGTYSGKALNLCKFELLLTYQKRISSFYFISDKIKFSLNVFLILFK